jgi:hypothetical protein
LTTTAVDGIDDGDDGATHVNCVDEIGSAMILAALVARRVEMIPINRRITLSYNKGAANIAAGTNTNTPITALFVQTDHINHNYTVPGFENATYD